MVLSLITYTTIGEWSLLKLTMILDRSIGSMMLLNDAIVLLLLFLVVVGGVVW
jgi:hypothetical protein